MVKAFFGRERMLGRVEEAFRCVKDVEERETSLREDRQKNPCRPTLIILCTRIRPVD